MSPDRLWPFLWGELQLLPAQMWTELNMNIWSGKPHTGLHAHAVTYALTHLFYLEHVQRVVSEGLRKGRPAVLSRAPSHLLRWEQQTWILGMACCSPLSACSPSHIYHTPPVVLWSRIKRADMGVENHEEEKVGD